MYGYKLKMIRELRNLSQEYIAEQCCIKQNTYSKIERDEQKLTAEMLDKLSRALGVSPMDIMNQEPTLISFNTKNDTLADKQENNTKFESHLLKELEFKNAEIMRLEQILHQLVENCPICATALGANAIVKSKS